MVKRPPSYMPISETQELSQKIEFDSVSMCGEHPSEFDDVDAFQDEFINVVMPLIESGPDGGQSFRGCSISNVHILYVIRASVKSRKIATRFLRKKNHGQPTI